MTIMKPIGTSSLWPTVPSDPKQSFAAPVKAEPPADAGTDTSKPPSIHFSRGWDEKWDEKITLLQKCTNTTLGQMGWGPCQTDGTICSEDLRLQFSKDRFQKEDPAIALLSEDGFDYLLKLAPSVLPAVSEHPPTLHVSITACKIPKSPAEKFRFGRVTQTRDLEEEQFPSLNRTGASSDARADLSWLSSEQGIRTVIEALTALTSLKSWDYPNDTPSEATGRGRSTMVDVVLGKMGSVCGSEEDLVRTLIGIYTARKATDDGSEATGSKGNTVSPKHEVESD